MRYLVWLLMVPGVAGAAAHSAILNMKSPTKNTDGTPITSSITYDIYQGAWGHEKLVRANWPLKSWVADPATLKVYNVRICWRVKAKVKGVASKYSADKCKWFF